MDLVFIARAVERIGESPEIRFAFFEIAMKTRILQRDRLHPLLVIWGEDFST